MTTLTATLISKPSLRTTTSGSKGCALILSQSMVMLVVSNDVSDVSLRSGNKFPAGNFLLNPPVTLGYHISSMPTSMRVSALMTSFVVVPGWSSFLWLQQISFGNLPDLNRFLCTTFETSHSNLAAFNPPPQLVKLNAEHQRIDIVVPVQANSNWGPRCPPFSRNLWQIPVNNFVTDVCHKILETRTAGPPVRCAETRPYYINSLMFALALTGGGVERARLLCLFRMLARNLFRSGRLPKKLLKHKKPMTSGTTRIGHQCRDRIMLHERYVVPRVTGDQQKLPGREFIT